MPDVQKRGVRRLILLLPGCRPTFLYALGLFLLSRLQLAQTEGAGFHFFSSGSGVTPPRRGRTIPRQSTSASSNQLSHNRQPTYRKTIHTPNGKYQQHFIKRGTHGDGGTPNKGASVFKQSRSDNGKDLKKTNTPHFGKFTSVDLPWNFSKQGEQASTYGQQDSGVISMRHVSISAGMLTTYGLDVLSQHRLQMLFKWSERPAPPTSFKPLRVMAREGTVPFRAVFAESSAWFHTRGVAYLETGQYLGLHSDHRHGHSPTQNFKGCTPLQKRYGHETGKKPQGLKPGGPL
ncbi:hypothetical protein CYMTET_53192 [Cymbomonas tetramitiformis]|uniref:Uncharacterized protein n=1 Tax=Cymbomonas tetramitiformis TaxID=36881 RepID=A0AAE0BJ99_9CHLO|nr:hypothetical protein CYMTET_53192 [Cymbomonas tetramitiformis]